MTAKEIIEKLKLTPLPEEGGYYRETYRSDIRFENTRDVSTAIYYLVIPESFSALQQVVVPRGVWQGLKLKQGGQWALMGTTVAPGFEFEDFEVGDRERLLAQFPQHREAITKFTRSAGEAIHGG